MYLNRKSSDGVIIELRKDGTQFGNIGVLNSDNPFFQGTATNHGGLQCGTNTILPCKSSANADNTLDLGQSDIRWKDIYLGGGAFIGGTGTANKLDDYEEGTWTPTAYSGITGLSVNGSQNTYTKVGRLVTVYCEINGFGGKSSSALNIGGLPFTPDSNSLYLHGAIDSDGGALGVSRTSAATGRINFYLGTTSRTNFTGNNLGSGARISLTYFAA